MSNVTFVGRTLPWQGLGYVIQDGDDLSTEALMEQANLLDWNVRLHPLTALVDDVEVPVEGKSLVLRDSPFNLDADGNRLPEALAVMGGRYEAVQNESVFALGAALVDDGAEWDTLGSFRGGRVVFGSFRLPRDIILDPLGASDTIRTYFTVATSHDGTIPVTGVANDVRVICMNTLNMAIRSQAAAWKFRHTLNVENLMAAKAEALRNAYRHADALEKEAQALYETAMTNAAFHGIVTNLYPEPDEDKKGAHTRWERKVELLGDIFAGTVEDGPDTISNIRGTAWAGLNALTERIDWYRSARGGDGSSLDEARSGFVPAVQAEKARVRSAVIEWARGEGAAV